MRNLLDGNLCEALESWQGRPRDDGSGVSEVQITMVAEEIETRTAPCPACGGRRKCWVRGFHGKSETFENLSQYTQATILQCCGCDKMFFEQRVTFTDYDDVDYNPETNQVEPVTNVVLKYWPPVTARNRPKWFEEIYPRDPQLKSLMDELYFALDHGLNVLAGIAVRTSFDRVTEWTGISPSLGFAVKLQKLLDDGRIGPTEKDILGVLVDAGNAAAHRGWKPSFEDLGTMMDVLEQFVHRTLILSHQSQQLKARVPKRV